MLWQFGNVVETAFKLDLVSLARGLEPFESFWQAYNPRKLNYGRRGLSLTSLDGQMTGVPDLDSLPEFNQIHGTNYDETSFSKTTRAVQEVPELARLFASFGSCLGRCHLIRFQRGGFFPPHRDLYLNDKSDTFRLLSVLTPGARSGDYHFVLDGQLRLFAPGTLYYVNTMLEHSLVAFKDQFMILVMNIHLNRESIHLIQSNLAIR